jgi:hypothetical protein
LSGKPPARRRKNMDSPSLEAQDFFCPECSAALERIEPLVESITLHSSGLLEIRLNIGGHWKVSRTRQLPVACENYSKIYNGFVQTLYSRLADLRFAPSSVTIKF